SARICPHSKPRSLLRSMTRKGLNMAAFYAGNGLSGRRRGAGFGAVRLAVEGLLDVDRARVLAS
ncbi:MAG: hypothetical protein VCE43_05020, partial [Myxococcota bacterium]